MNGLSSRKLDEARAVSGVASMLLAAGFRFPRHSDLLTSMRLRDVVDDSETSRDCEKGEENVFVFGLHYQ